MLKRTSRTKTKTPKKYSRPSLRGHREYRVQMTFLVSVSIKLKILTCPRHLYTNIHIHMYKYIERDREREIHTYIHTFSIKNYFSY